LKLPEDIVFAKRQFPLSLRGDQTRVGDVRLKIGSRRTSNFSRSVLAKFSGDTSATPFRDSLALDGNSSKTREILSFRRNKLRNEPPLPALGFKFGFQLRIPIARGIGTNQITFSAKF
jgi:hypothetical protein